MKVVSGDRYIRGDMGMTVRVRYDGKDLARPGAHAARVIATLDQAPVLLHSDAWPDYPGSVDELNRMRKALSCESDDALIVDTAGSDRSGDRP